ncbi:MAG: hypothetical protein ABIK89_01295 [Planctomycetota bacterium]
MAPYWLTGRRASAGEPTSKNDRPLTGVVGPGGRGLGDDEARAWQKRDGRAPYVIEA